MLPKIIKSYIIFYNSNALKKSDKNSSMFPNLINFIPNRFVSSLFNLREESPGNIEQFATWKGGYIFRNENITDSVTENQVALSRFGMMGHSENVR